jgi:hypothetical protein
MVRPALSLIWTRSRELSLKVRYHRTQHTMISWSKCRPLKRSGAELGSAMLGVTAACRSFQAFAPEPLRQGKTQRMLLVRGTGKYRDAGAAGLVAIYE